MKTDYSFDRNLLVSICTVSLMAPALRIFPSLAAEIAGRGGWLSAIVAFPGLLLYVFFLTKLMDCRREKEGLAELVLRAGGKAGKPLLWITAAWLILYCGFALRAAADRLITTVYPNSSPLFFTAIMAVTGLIAVLGSGRTIARTARLFVPLIVGALFVILVFALFSIDTANLTPVTAKDALPILRGAPAAIDVAVASLYCVCFFEGMTPKKPGRFKAFAIWTAAACGFLALLCADIIGDFGAELAAKLTRPFFSLVRNLVFFGSIERVEALMVALWVFPDFITFSLFLYSAQHSLRLSLGVDCIYKGQGATELGEGRWLIPCCAAAALLISVFLTPDSAAMKFWSDSMIPAINMGFALVFLPAVFFFGKIRKNI